MCNGTGYQEVQKRKCPRCNGKGHVDERTMFAETDINPNYMTTQTGDPVIG